MDNRLEESFDSTYHLEGNYPQYYSLPKFINAGRLKFNVPWDCREHHHVEYEYIYIKKGKIRYWCNGIPLIAQEGDVYFIQPHQSHQEESLSPELEFLHLTFYYLDLNGRVKYIVNFNSPQKQIIKNAGEEFAEIFHKICMEVINKKPGSKEVIEAFTLQLIWLSRRKLNIYEKNSTIDLKVEIVNKAIEYIRDNTHNNISLMDIASYCCISQDYLSHIFKSITGISPLQFVIFSKIDEAKYLLKNTKASLGEISENLAYGDQAYFSRVFKKNVGITPKEFRAERGDGSAV